MSQFGESLAELVDRVDLDELIARDAGPGRRQGGRTVYRCPNAAQHAHGDRTPSFVVSTHKGRPRWRCFGACQTGGDALDYVKWIHGLDTADGIRWLREWTGTVHLTTGTMAPRMRTTPPSTSTVRRAAEVLTPPEYTGELPPDDIALDVLARYCRWRGWPLEIAERYGLHTVTLENHFYVRHPFHVPTAAGPMVFGWQDRAIDSVAAARHKWRAPKGWPLPLWGTPSLVDAVLPAVIVCEGPADGISASYALDGYGPVPVVAVPGVATWRDDWTPLFRGLHVVTAADPDTAGERLTQRLADDLDGVAVTVTPADMGLLVDDLTGTLKAYGPDYLAAALLAPLHTVGVLS